MLTKYDKTVILDIFEKVSLLYKEALDLKVVSYKQLAKMELMHGICHASTQFSNGRNIVYPLFGLYGPYKKYVHHDSKNIVITPIEVLRNEVELDMNKKSDQYNKSLQFRYDFLLERIEELK